MMDEMGGLRGGRDCWMDLWSLEVRKFHGLFIQPPSSSAPSFHCTSILFCFSFVLKPARSGELNGLAWRGVLVEGDLFI